MPRLKVHLSKLREIGWAKWDPIGLRGLNCPDDEYDAYLWQAAGMAAAGRSSSAIADYLVYMAREHMGLTKVDPATALATAADVCAYIESLRVASTSGADQEPGPAARRIITRSDMFEPLLRADPSFEPVWQAFCLEWRDAPEPPLYLALSELARHLIANLEAGATSRFEHIFDVVESWCSEGDGYVQEAAAVGFLESLQNTGLHGATTPADFIPWLGPVTFWYWNEVEEFWGTKKIIGIHR